MALQGALVGDPWLYVELHSTECDVTGRVLGLDGWFLVGSNTAEDLVDGPGEPAPLMTSAGPDHHVPVLFKYHIGAVVKIENRYGGELGGGAARLGNGVRTDKMNLCGDGKAGLGYDGRAPRDEKAEPDRSLSGKSGPFLFQSIQHSGGAEINHV